MLAYTGKNESITDKQSACQWISDNLGTLEKRPTDVVVTVVDKHLLTIGNIIIVNGKVTGATWYNIELPDEYINSFNDDESINSADPGSRSSVVCIP